MKQIVVVSVFSMGLIIYGLNRKAKMSPIENIPTAVAILTPKFIPKEPQEKSIPEVKLNLSLTNNETLTWGDFVQYTIEVSDKVDGESKYGEISNNSVLLQIEFLPVKDYKRGETNVAPTQKERNPEGLSLMMGSTCFACHADKEVLTGPSFLEIASRYKREPKDITLLANRIQKGSAGQWGSMEMPAHPNLTVEETEKISEFILKQGSRKNHKLITGLEGTFQVREKPNDLAEGILILTASYTSTSSVKGQHRITLQIK